MDIEMTIKYLIEEKKELEHKIKVGKEAEKTIVFTQEKLKDLMQKYFNEVE